ncbi:virulence factor [Mycolicibacterium arabiense]|uniref:Virulence factor n=1 Tax=Mycolicibacterium arabiense TaxID=1286181 RepID=A0A7I7S7D6_9MYCO|nr:MCE family protein [Mycolicibacterium arabiense]MCV7376714.1 MCE family protein [Mycolicibacterium arabiense]BBY52370.1 virulence factor [Mycolicibacterium arabiense]
MSSSVVRPLAGLGMVIAIVAIVVFSIGMFRGGFGTTVPVTVVSERAGLVMNPEAKVKMRGVQVGQVERIENRPDGTAVLHLAMDPKQLQYIPANVDVNLASTTVFGAKSVELVAPADPSSTPLAKGQQLDAQHVTVETNTLFQQLTSVLKSIDPVQLNETLAAISGALNGRGEKFGQTVTDFNAFFKSINPSLGNIARDLEVAPVALNAYADAAPDLVNILDSTTKVGDTLVDQEDNLDRFLVSAIGLADTGNDVVGTNRQPLTDVLRMLVPTTEKLSQYSDNLRCGIQALNVFVHSPPPDRPGVDVSASFTLGVERYRYPEDLPIVAAKSGSSCKDQMLPAVPNGKRPPFLVTDIGANPWKYGNQGVLLNSDALKQALFGPVQGPPRNSAQIGMPG